MHRTTPSPRRPPAEPDPGFTRTWLAADAIPGWLTEDQARLLWTEARRLRPTELVVEIGSHQGRSTAVLASAIAAQAPAVVAIDPFIDGRLFGGPATRELFTTHLMRLGLEDRVRLIPRRSTELRAGWTDEIGLLYIDGKHDYWTVSDDLRWRTHLRPGARVLVHDSFSSIGVTLALLRHVLAAGDLAYRGRVGSLARFEVGPVARSDRLRLVAELPWWLRNVIIKIGLRGARVGGYRGTPDPY